MSPLTTRETKMQRAKATCPSSCKDVNERSRSGVQTPLRSILASILFVAFPKISLDRETEAAGLLSGSSWEEGLLSKLTQTRSHPRSHLCFA